MTAMTLSPRFMRFIAVGALNSAFGFVAYTGLIMLSSPVWFALIGGNVAGLVFNFVTTGGLVFKDLSLARVPRFVLAYLVVYGSNLGMIHLMTKLLNSPIVAQAILTPPLAVIAYLLMTNYVYSDSASFKKAEAALPE